MSEREPRKKPKPQVYIDPALVPSEVLAFLDPGRIRTPDDLVDFHGVVLRAMLQGKIPPIWHKILKEVGELMFTAVASKRPDGPKFNIEALLLAENQQIVMQPPPERRQIVEVLQPPSLGPTRDDEHQIIELDFTDTDEPRLHEGDPFSQFKRG